MEGEGTVGFDLCACACVCGQGASFIFTNRPCKHTSFTTARTHTHTRAHTHTRTHAHTHTRTTTHTQEGLFRLFLFHTHTHTRARCCIAYTAVFALILPFALCNTQGFWVWPWMNARTAEERRAVMERVVRLMVSGVLPPHKGESA